MHSCTGLKRAHGTPIDNVCRRLEKSTKPLDIKINYGDHINREKYEYFGFVVVKYPAGYTNKPHYDSYFEEPYEVYNIYRSGRLRSQMYFIRNIALLTTMKLDKICTWWLELSVYAGNYGAYGLFVHCLVDSLIITH